MNESIKEFDEKRLDEYFKKINTMIFNSNSNQVNKFIIFGMK